MTTKLSPIEIIKTQSRGLRGTLVQSLNNALTGQISEADQALIKFHGAYQQDDRDRRLDREQKKLERAYSFMIRLRIPGGDISAEQWQGLDRIAKSYGTGVIKITTRQTVQIHGILKSHMKPTIQDFYHLGLDSIAGCGDVNRNVMAGVHPSLTPFHAEVHDFAKKLSEHLLPTSRAFHEIWLDGEKLSSNEPEEDPLYQDRYLPRKFKIAIAIPPHNETDVFINDLGFIAIEENGQFIGFNVSVGGGLGATHGNSATYPRLGDVIGFIPKEKTLEVAWQVIAVQRDFGNREDRRFSRLKYTIDNMGVEKFKQTVEERLGFQFLPAKPFTFTKRGDFYGWQQDIDGLFYFTAFVESGRVENKPNYNIEQLLFEVTKQKLCGIRFTGNQNMMLTRIKDREAVQILLEKHGIAAQNFSRVRRDALACVALNTCPLAMAEAQRYLPDFLIKVEELIAKHHLHDRDLMLRMTGCPNGCGRPYVAEIGLIGKALGQYNLHFGGDGVGQRLNRLYADSQNEEQLLAHLDQWFGKYAAQAFENEGFGDFMQRIGF
jgi:sulfite reductase (NADPH) hemoprotein beta-component